MTTKAGEFDANGFYEALDSTRIAREMNWRKVAQESGIPASTLTRMAQGKRPDVDSLAALVSWSGLNIDEFVRPKSKRPQPEALAMISTYLRSDPNLTNDSAIALDELVKATYERLKKKKR